MPRQGESTTAEVVETFEAVPGDPAIGAERRGCHDGSLTGYSHRDEAHEDWQEERESLSPSAAVV